MGIKEKLFAPECNSLLYRLIVKGCPDDNKERCIRRVNSVLTVLAGIMIVFSLIRALAACSSLPDDLGVHFLGMRYISDKKGNWETLRLIYHGGKQPYDVFGPKLLMFYPHFISTMVFTGSKLAVWLFGKISRKSSMDDFVKLKLKQGLTLSLDVVTIDFCLYFCIIWNECILRQAEMRMIFTQGYVVIVLLCLFELIAFSLILNKSSKDKQK